MLLDRQAWILGGFAIWMIIFAVLTITVLRPRVSSRLMAEAERQLKTDPEARNLAVHFTGLRGVLSGSTRNPDILEQIRRQIQMSLPAGRLHVDQDRIQFSETPESSSEPVADTVAERSAPEPDAQGELTQPVASEVAVATNHPDALLGSRDAWSDSPDAWLDSPVGLESRADHIALGVSTLYPEADVAGPELSRRIGLPAPSVDPRFQLLPQQLELLANEPDAASESTAEPLTAEDVPWSEPEIMSLLEMPRRDDNELEEMVRETMVFFDTNSSDLDAEALESLEDLASELAKGDRLELIGFADPRGNPTYNRRLSERRIAAVKDKLADLGVAVGATRVEAGLPSESARQMTAAELRYQRRVEFRLMP